MVSIEGQIFPLQDNLLKVGNDALKLNVPPEIMREAILRTGCENVQKLADTYDRMYGKFEKQEREMNLPE